MNAVYEKKFNDLVAKVTDVNRGTFMSIAVKFGELSIIHQQLLTKDGSLMSPDWDIDKGSKYEVFLDVLSDMIFEISIFAKRYGINVGTLNRLAKFDKLERNILRYKKGNFTTMTQLLGQLSHSYQRSMIGNRNVRSVEWNPEDRGSIDVLHSLQSLLRDMAIFAKRHDVSLNIAIENTITRLEDN